MDSTRTEQLLTGWLASRGALARVDVHELLRELTSTRVRDAALAIAAGYPEQARSLLEGRDQPQPWFMAGPLCGRSIAAATRATDLLESAASRTGELYSYAPATIGAYLDWVRGEPVGAVQRLAKVPAAYTMAGYLKYHLAIGTPPPLVLARLDTEGSLTR